MNAYLQNAIWNQNDARIISKIARQELDRFLENPTDENRFWAIHAQNAASDTQHCAMFCMGVVEWVVRHPGTPVNDAPGTSYSDFTPNARNV